MIRNERSRNLARSPRQPGRTDGKHLFTAVLAAVLGLTWTLAWTAGPAAAAVRTEIPEEDPGPPFYARVERQAVHTDLVPHTEKLAAVVFYRSPACIPADFNLMDLFDPPAAFGCTLTVDGFEIWTNGPPPIDMIPRFARFGGLGAVPVWIVSWPELEAAAADDVLTVPELMALPSLQMGTAAFYHETLHPTGGAENPALSLTAFGTLVDGRSFGLHHSGRAGGVRSVIRIFE